MSQQELETPTAAAALVQEHISDRYEIEALMARWGAHQAPTKRHAQIVVSSDVLASCALVDLAKRLDRPLLIVTPSDQSARSLSQEMTIFASQELEFTEEQRPRFLEQVALYPEYDMGPFHQASPDRKVTLERLTTLYKLTREQKPRVTISSIRALMRKTIPAAAMRRHSKVISLGDEVDNRALREYLTDCGYSEVPVVEDPGTFAIRGDIIDIYSPLYPHPVRLERWGDEITEVRMFHEETQRTLEERLEIELFPVRQEILDDETLNLAFEQVHRRAAALKLPSSVGQGILADLKAGIHFIGIDAILPALHKRLDDLLAYLPEDVVVVLVRPDSISLSVQELWLKRESEQTHTQRQDDQKHLHFEIADYYTEPEALIGALRRGYDRLDVRAVVIRQEASPLQFELPDEQDSFEVRAKSNADIVQLRKSCHGIEQTISSLSERLKGWAQRYGRICFVCRTQGQVKRLKELLEQFYGEADVLPTPIDVSEPVPPPAFFIEIYKAPLSEGFRSEAMGLCLISSQEIFGQRAATTTDQQKFSEHAAISHFRDLTIGDLVVHIDFGIGRYMGLVHMEVGGMASDFLQLEYAGNDKLYLPVYRLGRVQKYIGSTEGVRLDKLGSTSWERTKEKVKANIREIAGDLLKLYAQREMMRGYAFTPPDDTFRDFEGRFPYEETTDQARAIIETISDMTAIRPMDRLICGDVGFGKTEVAIRAAMKAVLDARQVAVLVPTTLLAEQHLVSFRKRLAEFGAVVECLSRFRADKDARDIIKRTAEGKVDVLIGTHRLLNKDIVFRQLGLLVVDEEQRFGVGHKERIKKMSRNIDVLTLSATPIPRTLQMSLLGIRDLSIIATPPHDRLSVRTHVAKSSDGIIREAVMMELSRGGQVFFVHNRVKTMPEQLRHLKELLPEAKFGVAHGQMSEDDLEEVMLQYVRGEINVLLCSSIIETGLDIPNANTIIINRADMFGLSQLYQLRGRVGRGKERAYAYLLIPRTKLPADAEKRLDVIQTHTELGSGFHVASYDLEIRGAGNLLGDDQSGHVASVGLDLYNELLEEAIHDLRGEVMAEEIDPEVNIPVPSYLPEDYIPATPLRLMFYKRFSLAQAPEELDVVYHELRDRFGPLPDPVRNLYEIVAVKIALKQLRARRLDAGPSAISIDLDATTTLNPSAVVRLVQESRGKLRLMENMKVVYNLKPDESAQPLKTARMLVDALLAAR